MRTMGMMVGRPWRSGLALVLMGATLLGVHAEPEKSGKPGGTQPGPAANVVTVAKVKELQTLFQAERAAAAKSGTTRMFSPEWYEKADRLAKQGEAALEANHLVTALARFRAARRHLPTLDPCLPPHLTRVFGDGRWRHAGSVLGVAYSPDGKYLASAGQDGLVKVFDTATNNIIACCKGHTDEVRGIAFSPDSKILASASKGDVRLWDAKTGKEIQSLKGAADFLRCVAFSPDGKTLAAGGAERILFGWDTTTGKLKFDLRHHNLVIRGVAFSPDGKKLVSVGEDGIARTYDLTKPGGKPVDLLGINLFSRANAVVFKADSQYIYAAGDSKPNVVKLFSIADLAERRVFEGIKDSAGVNCLALSKDGKTLAAGFDSKIRLWDTSSGQAFRTLAGHGGDVLSLAFSPDGLTLVSGSADGTMRSWSLGTGAQHRSLTGHQGIVWSSAFSPDGKRLVTAGADRIVRVWDARTDKELLALKGHKSAVTDARFSPDGKYILSCGGDRVLRLWNAADGSAVRVFSGHTAPVTSIAFSPDGKQILSGSADRSARIWDTESGRVLHVLAGHRAVVSAVAWSRDGKHLATGSADHTARLWNAEGKPERTLGSQDDKQKEPLGAVSAVAFSPNSQLLATCGNDYLIRLWNVDIPGPPTDLKGHDAVVYSVAFSPDGKTLASAGQDEVVKLWDVATESELLGFRGHTSSISSVAFSPDGHFLTSAGVDRTVRIWELGGSDGGSLELRDAEVRALAVSPDGKLLAAASGVSDSKGGDNLIRIWELATGRQVQSLTGHKGQIWSLAFLPDSKTLVSTANDPEHPSMKVWDTGTGKELRSFALAEDSSDVNDVPVLLALTDGKHVQAWMGTSQVGVFDVTTGKRELANLIEGTISCLSFSTDGKVAAIGFDGGTAQLWDRTTGKPLPGEAVNAGRTKLTDLILTPDKKTLVTGDEEGRVKIWDLANRAEPLHSVKGHNARIQAFAMSPKGKHFATIGDDNVIKLWDLEGQELRRWDLHRSLVEKHGFVRTLLFTTDGKGLVTANGDTSVYLLDCTGAKAK